MILSYLWTAVYMSGAWRAWTGIDTDVLSAIAVQLALGGLDAKVETMITGHGPLRTPEPICRD